ncbi:MAG: M28 family peptidase [Anaerolineales bacterium]
MPAMRKKILFLSAILLLLGGAALWAAWPRPKAANTEFDGQRAYQDVARQVELGPRIPGTEGHARGIAYIQSELKAAGWQSEVVEDEFGGQVIKNIRAWRAEAKPVILLGAHYDTRIYADNDPHFENHAQPVPGANDGASGVAVLLELARVLPKDTVPVNLVFFDAEDNGRIEGWDWILGSSAYAASIQSRPQAVVIVDMIGDADLNIYMERNSDPELTRQIWGVAKRLGYEQFFIPEYKYRVLDDHIPFLSKGLKAVDIIDLDYPHWHTLADTPDKVSADSLQVVGKTLLAWLLEYGACIAQSNCNAE